MSTSAIQNQNLSQFDNAIDLLRVAFNASVKMMDSTGDEKEKIRFECDKLENNFIDIISQIVQHIGSISTYKNMCKSYDELCANVDSGMLTNKFLVHNVSETTEIASYAFIKKFSKMWRSVSILSLRDIDNAVDTLSDPTYVYLMLYEIIVQPTGQSFELYKYVCTKFFDLISQYSYLLQYDAVLNNPIVCELVQRSYYNFFSSYESVDRFDRRNYFLRELISQQSEFILHMDINDINVVDCLRNLRKS